MDCISLLGLMVDGMDGRWLSCGPGWITFPGYSYTRQCGIFLGRTERG